MEEKDAVIVGARCAGSTLAIGFLSFGVWAHHMFAVGMGFPLDVAFGATTSLIAIPTGVKIFNWIATMWGDALRLTTAMLFAIGFIVSFTIGGLSGVLFALVPKMLCDSLLQWVLAADVAGPLALNNAKGNAVHEQHNVRPSGLGRAE